MPSHGKERAGMKEIVESEWHRNSIEITKSYVYKSKVGREMKKVGHGFISSYVCTVYICIDFPIIKF